MVSRAADKEKIRLHLEFSLYVTMRIVPRNDETAVSPQLDYGFLIRWHKWSDFQFHNIIAERLLFRIHHMAGISLFLDFANSGYPSILNKVFSSIKILTTIAGIRTKRKIKTVAVLKKNNTIPVLARIMPV